jgi:hypothetical protein
MSMCGNIRPDIHAFWAALTAVVHGTIEQVRVRMTGELNLIAMTNMNNHRQIRLWLS